MLRFCSYEIVFQELPDQTTLAINITGCPNRCSGCHSPWLREQSGERLDESALATLLDQYGSAITAVCFMGGDNDPTEVARLAEWTKSNFDCVKTGWYSGRTKLPADFDIGAMDYIKLGPYIESLGGLRSPTTNQQLYRVTGNRLLAIPIAKK